MDVIKQTDGLSHKVSSLTCSRESPSFLLGRSRYKDRLADGKLSLVPRLVVRRQWRVGKQIFSCKRMTSST
jgi:hypothetical protein